jgi:hypothetical protein
MKCNNSSNFKKPSIPTNYSQLETMQIFSAINLIGETMYEFFKKKDSHGTRPHLRLSGKN